MTRNWKPASDAVLGREIGEARADTFQNNNGGARPGRSVPIYFSPAKYYLVHGSDHRQAVRELVKSGIVHRTPAAGPLEDYVKLSLVT